MVDQAFVDRLTLRKARPWDGRRAAHLVRELAGDADDAAVRRRFRRLVLRASYHVYLLEDDGEPVAMWIGREGYFLGADAPFLQMLGYVVHPDLQRQGLGSLLAFNFLSQIYGHSDFSQFWFITQHEHLHDFYEGFGFQKTGVRFTIHERGSGKPSVPRRISRRLGI